jgi:gliding motility-associated-like protein
MLACLSISAQDFSNKGKEFWLSYSYHVGMVNSGGFPTMTLYISSDVATNYQVEIYGVTVLQSGSLSPGDVALVDIPTAYFINNEGLFTNRTIRVTGDKPIVVYSYITRNAASGATLCLPTNVLGKEYYSTNYTQVSNEANSNSFFTIIAVEDNTTVEITPAANTKNGWVAGSTHSVNLNKGQIYQVLGTTTGNNGVDLTGSKIKSVASGTGGCKRIAVFSGSGKIRIAATSACPASVNSSDNLYQQLYPVATWGKKYLTIPSYNRPTSIYRVLKSDPDANVYVNGSLIPSSSFINNIYYEFYNTIPNDIESDQPISVAQYFTTQGCDGNANPYDPDMIMLNPVEQNIDKVTLVSSNLVASPPQHHIHVIMKNGGTGISSFTLDGNPVPAASWTVHPRDPSYSYIYLSNVTQGYHRLVSDSGFNAIAYGYAPAETYGYSAGASVKDLYQFVSVQNQYATVNYPATCSNTPFYFTMTFPYQPTQIQWVFGGLFPDVTLNSPAYDATTNVNGKQLYSYKLPTPYVLNTPGTYPIKVLAQNPTSDGCSGEQEINYDLQVYDRPHADFTFTASGCVSDAVHFTDNANTNGRTSIKWAWDFGDGNTDIVRNPVHLYGSAGSFNVKYYTITDIGCISDTVTKTVALSVPPVAKFGISAPDCQGKAISFSDSSTTASGAIAKWYWDFGDGSPVVIATTNATQTHTYPAASTYTVTLKVETANGCASPVYSATVTTHVIPAPGFTFGNECLPSGQLAFTNTSSISDGTGSTLSYYWDFGDGGNSAVQNPSYNYTAAGPFNAKLVVTAASGCKDSITKAVNTIYAQPVAAFTATPEVCLGTATAFTDQSSAANSTITQWAWDFGDGSPVAITQNPTHTYTTPGTHTITLKVTSAIGCESTVTTHTVIVNDLPKANFNVSAPTCLSQNITFTDASTTASGTIVKWTWDLGDGTTPVYTTNAAFTHSYGTAGTYHVSLIVQTDKGCISTAFTKDVVVSVLPAAEFTLPDNCLNDPFSQFTDASTISDGTGSSFSYLWNFADPFATSSNPNTSTIKNPQHRYTQAATYNVSLTITSAAGCTSTVTHAYTVNGAVPQSVFAVTGGTQVCSNKTVSITDQSTVDVGRLVKLEIFWDDANDPANKTTVNFPAAGATYNHTYPEFFTPASKPYRIRVVAYSGDNCASTSTQTITLKATPQIVSTTIPGVCSDVPPFQVTQVGVSNLTGTPLFSGTGISATGLFNPATAGTGSHSIHYTFTADNGCVNEKDVTVAVFAQPTVNAGPDRFVLEGGNAVLLATASGNNLSYLWTPSTFLNSPTILQPTATPITDIDYTIVVTSSDGCTATDAVSVTFLKAPTIPNVFSPNGDGINDRWEIKYLESYPGATVQIYNRYGQAVFQSVGYNKAWDGTQNGKPLPAGTYYYIINPKNGRQQMSGFVDIVR